MKARDEIERTLRREVEHFHKAYNIATNEFQNVAADIPSGLPCPDGTDRLINAGKAYRFAMNAYAKALEEYNDFVLTGSIPERLKKD